MNETGMNPIAVILLLLVVGFVLLPITILSTIGIVVFRFYKVRLLYLWGAAVVLNSPCFFSGFGVLKYSLMFVLMEIIKHPQVDFGYLAKVTYGTVVISAWIVTLYETNKRINPKLKKKEDKDREKNLHNSSIYQWLIKRVETKTKEQKAYDGVFLGIDVATRKPIILDDEELNHHTFLTGTTGAGKTTTIETFVEAAVHAKKPMVMIDGKGDTKFALMAYKYAKENKIPFRIFSLSNGDHVWNYNPLAYGNFSELKDRLIAMGEWGEEPFFKGRGARYLQIELRILSELGIECDLENVIRYMEPSALTMLVRKHPDKSQADYYMSVIEGYDPQHIQSTIDQIAIFTESNIGSLFKEKTGKTIRLYDALTEGGITLFSLDSLLYPEQARSVGRLILTDLKSAAAKHRETSGAPVSAVFDEFNVYASPQVVDFINKSRSAGFEALIATQSLADIDKVDKYLCNQIIQNCNTVIIQRQNEPSDAERLAATIGTEDTAGMTYQTDERNIFDDKTGRGSMRVAKEFIVHPDEIKRLRTGEAIVLRKTPEFKVQRTKVVYLGKKADSFDSLATQENVNTHKELTEGTLPDDDREWFVLTKKRSSKS